MHNNKKLIFIAGLGSTGSSAVCDIFSEYAGVYCPKQEWRIWVDPNGLVDFVRGMTEESSMFMQTESMLAFEKLVKALVNGRFGAYGRLKLPSEVKRLFEGILSDVKLQLGLVRYKGLWYGNSNRVLSALNFRFNRALWKKSFVSKDMYLNEDLDFDSFSRRLGLLVESRIDKFLNDMSMETLAINENFSILFVKKIFALHPESKMILVVRNPFDVYADSKRVGWMAMPYDIDQFVTWQNTLYRQVQTAKNMYPEKIHIVNFDALVGNYSDELKSIVNFSDGILTRREKEIFDPSISKKNVGQWIASHPELERHKDRFFFWRDPLVAESVV